MFCIGVIFVKEECHIRSSLEALLYWVLKGIL